MEESIRQFHTQFEYTPVVENAGKLPKTDKFIVCGMGGSHLSAGLLKAYRPTLDLLIHRDYGMPKVPDYFLREALIILSSYSGTTEETLDAFHEALQAGLNVAVVSTGGVLLEEAKKRGLPYVELPKTGIQPRTAIGYSLAALLKLIGDEPGLGELSRLPHTLNPAAYEEGGKSVAEALSGKIPAVHTSTLNYPLGYNWKIRFNETGKIPAFCNALPELNHNEMTGFLRPEGNKALSDRFSFIFLRDSEDHPRVQKRMEVLKKLYEDRGLPVTILDLQGETVWHKLFGSILVADWTSLYLAKAYGVDPKLVVMVEEFKKLLA